MICCACNKGTLMPTRINNGPEAYQCNACNGALLILATYMDWVRSQRGNQTVETETQSSAVPNDADADVGIAHSNRALSCPKCSRIMRRFNILFESAHVLDLCQHCEAVWLDAGEWQFLKAHGLHTSITTISSETYQRRLREQAVRNAASQRFRETVGEASFGEVQKFADWLKDQPMRDAILRHLNSELRP